VIDEEAELSYTGLMPTSFALCKPSLPSNWQLFSHWDCWVFGPLVADRRFHS